MRLTLATMMLGLGSLAGCSDPAAKQLALDNEARAALDETTRDPVAMQVRRVALKDDSTICGEVNRKLKSDEYEGFQVFVVDRKSGKAIVAEPYAVQSKDGAQPIEICADAEQKRRYAQRKAQSDAEFERQLAEYERQTKVMELEAKQKLARALRE